MNLQLIAACTFRGLAVGLGKLYIGVGIPEGDDARHFGVLRERAVASLLFFLAGY